MITQLVYVSTPIDACIDEFNSSLPLNQIKNNECGITGMMLTHKHFYMQLIEGDRSLVNLLYNKIVVDSRHRNVTLVKYQDIVTRQFDDWYYAVIDKDIDPIFYRSITDLVNVGDDFVNTVSGPVAMCVLHRTAAIACIKTTLGHT